MDFFNDLQRYYASMTQQESLFFWITVLAVFLFAFLLGYLLRGAGVKRYKKRLLVAERERSDFEAQYIAVNEKQKSLSREVEQLSKEKVAALEELSEIKKNAVSAENADSGDFDAREAGYQEEIQLLQLEINDLKAQLAGVPPPTAPAVEVPATDNERLNAYLTETESRFAAFEARLTELDRENARLEAELHEIKQEGGAVSDGTRSFGSPHVPVVGQPAVETDEDGEPLVIRADVTEPGVRTNEAGSTEVIVDTNPSLQVPLVSADDQDVDDLKAIKNIGPFLERKLNEIGVFSYEQMAKWTQQDIERITGEIGYLPGRIQADNWVGQARQLAREEVLTEAVAVPPSRTAASTDLKAVEGIGPKIEQVLKAAGVEDLAALSETTPERLREILADAGNRFKSHDPSTWPIQAELAKNGQWPELGALQDKLKGGR